VSNVPGAFVDVTSTLGGALLNLLMADDIQPGSDPGYQLCKAIFLYHPLGRKMTEAPIRLAQSQKRIRTVQDAPNELVEELDQVWKLMKGDDLVCGVQTLARVYGIASLVILVDDEDSAKPIDPWKLAGKKVTFNLLDPLNTSGSLVLNQVPTSQEFMKPATVRSSGKTWHPTRFAVTMNEQPVYIAYTSAAFGFVGRSVYQRALFPLKSFVRTMIANDMVATKLGLLVAKQEKPGSIIDNIMAAVAGRKRSLLQQAQTNQILSIGTEEAIETLNMMNVDGAGKFARDNILVDIATAADMPAAILKNETLTAGFGEGIEDAKNNARYINGVRTEIEPLYGFLEPIAMHRAWDENFYERLKAKYPERYRNQSYEDFFTEARQNYSAEWEEFLIEPESEAVNVEKTKSEAITAVAQSILDKLDPENQLLTIEWLVQNIQENKRLVPHELELDLDDLRDHLKEQAERNQNQEDNMAGEDNDVAKKAGNFTLR
jgi:hypothetical protein